MDKRSILIIIALALPVITILWLANQAPETPVIDAPKSPSPVMPGSMSSAPTRLPPTERKARAVKSAPADAQEELPAPQRDEEKDN